jgi:hypothetical protein
MRKFWELKAKHTFSKNRKKNFLIFFLLPIYLGKSRFFAQLNIIKILRLLIEMIFMRMLIKKNTLFILNHLFKKKKGCLKAICVKLLLVFDCLIKRIFQNKKRKIYNQK